MSAALDLRNLQPASDYTNDELAREVIKRKKAVGVIVEMGSGPTIMDTISDEAGSSGNVIYGIFPNHKSEQEKIGKSPEMRSVSIEAVEAMRDGVSETRNDVTTLISSAQIPSQPTDDVDTHACLALEHEGRKISAHVTFDVGRDRREAKAQITRSGLRLLLSEGHADQIGCIFADQLYDEEGKDLVNETLAQFEYLPEGEEHLVMITQDGKLQRPMNYFRKMNAGKKMAIYKGSFNPITKAHLAIAKQYEEGDDGVKPVFMISINNRDIAKGKVSAADVAKRIQLINAMGYDAMVCSNGGFVENAQMFRHRGFEGVIDFLAGADVADRVETHQRTDLKRWGNKIYLAKRGNQHVETDTQLFRKLRVAGTDNISSTQIRERKPGWQEGIHEDILDLYQELFPEHATVA